MLTTIEGITRCNCKIVLRTEEGYFVIYRADDNNCGMYDEIEGDVEKGRFLLNVKRDRKTGRYSGWLMHKLEKVCPVNNAIFYTYDELHMEHSSIC
jgi:hypothetical protein